MLWCNYHAVNSMSRKTSLRLTHAHTHTHTHTLFNGRFSRTTRVSRYQKGKTIWILLKQETVIGSGISWAICKSATRSRETTMPAPHQLISFLQAGCPSCRPTNSVKALKANSLWLKICQKLLQAITNSWQTTTNVHKCYQWCLTMLVFNNARYSS